MGKKTKKPGKGKEKTVKKTAKAEEKRARRESKKISPEDDIDAILVFIFEFLWKLFKILQYLLFVSLENFWEKNGSWSFCVFEVILGWSSILGLLCYMLRMIKLCFVLEIILFVSLEIFLREIVFCGIIFWWELNYGTVMLYDVICLDLICLCQKEILWSNLWLVCELNCYVLICVGIM